LLPLENISSCLPSISLEDAMLVDLNARYDLKILLPYTMAIRLLESEYQEILIQKHGQKTYQNYKNIYFDTADFDFYKTHGLGKSKRLKIRKRFYSDTQSCFMEIKLKQSFKTIKHRVSSVFTNQLSIEDHSLIEQHFKDSKILIPTLSINYDRMVIWKKDLSGRITLDFNYQPFFGNVSTCFDHAVIMELKGSYQFINWALRAFDVPISRFITPFSKYCIGLEETNKQAKKPMKYFRAIHQQLSKLNNPLCSQS
jgi:hypothetical protein